MASIRDWLLGEVSQSSLTYLIVFAACGLDVLFPLIPSETVLITAAVLAAQGELLIVLLVAAAAGGAFLGDNVANLLGRTVGASASERIARGEKGRRRLRWAEGAIRERGVAIILVGRFLPGGRSASTLAAGTLGMPYRRFAPADAAAASAWAVYVALLGFVGGETFKHEIWLPLAIAFGVVSLLTISIEAWRRLHRRRHGREPLSAGGGDA